MPMINGLREKTKADDRAQARQPEQTNPKKLRGRLPSKRTINLATVNVKRVNWLVAVPLIVLILAGAAALSQFAVVNRYAAIESEQRDVAQLQARLDEGYRALAAFGPLNERYAHYSYANMTAEEMARVDRVEAIRLLQRVVPVHIETDSWSLNENILMITIRAGQLQDVNELAQEMLKEDIVDYCAVRSAATIEEQTAAAADGEPALKVERVMAVIAAVLKQPEQEAVS